MTLATKVSRIAKRGLDVIGSLVGLILASPLLAVIGLIVLVADGWPVFIALPRVGRHGRVFAMWKIRTMIRNAAAQRAALEHQHGCPVWQMAHDPRVTPVGRFLRRWSFDELPQLWNVLIGEMSLVGFRPPSPCELRHLQPGDERAFQLPPGLTGPVQVGGRKALSIKEQIQLSKEYTDHWSLRRDIGILAQTAAAVLRHPLQRPRGGTMKPGTAVQQVLVFLGTIMAFMLLFVPTLLASFLMSVIGCVCLLVGAPVALIVFGGRFWPRGNHARRAD